MQVLDLDCLKHRFRAAKERLVIFVIFLDVDLVANRTSETGVELIRFLTLLVDAVRNILHPLRPLCFSFHFPNLMVRCVGVHNTKKII